MTDTQHADDENGKVNVVSEEEKETTFICSKARSFKVHVGNKRHVFVNGRLVLKGKEAEELRALVDSPAHTLRSWISIVSVDEADRFVRELLSQRKGGAIKGGLHSGSIAEANKPAIKDLETQLLAQGVSPDKLGAVGQLLEADGFAITQQIPIEAVKSAVARAEASVDGQTAETLVAQQQATADVATAKLKETAASGDVQPIPGLSLLQKTK